MLFFAAEYKGQGMIFKRVAGAMRRQDWSTVCLEVVIVVVGVYLGIFIGDTANDRALQADVHRTLEFLQAQLQEDLANLDNIVAIHVSGRDTYERAINLISQSPVDGAAFAEASSHAMLVHRTFFPNRSAYETIRQLGYLAEVTDVELQLLVANLYERIYERQTKLADRMDDVVVVYQTRARDIYWDWAGRAFISDGSEGATRMRNALIFIKNFSGYYRFQLDSFVRPELEKTINALEAYLEQEQDV